MRLIDADALVAQEEFFAKIFKGDFGEQVATHVIEVINDAPTVDAVPVIRCKDCKHWSKPHGWNGFCEHDYLNWILEHEEPTVEAIPIEWLKNWNPKELNDTGYQVMRRIIDDWEKRNEAD